MQVTLSQCENALEALKKIEYLASKGKDIDPDAHLNFSRAIDVIAALITDAEDSGALYDEEECDKPQICGDCGGSGEGKFEGSICEYCNGRGEW